MKPEAQRIAIAEACGWEEIHTQPFTDSLNTHYKRLFGYPRIDGGLCYESEPIPDYLTDLNAMHEAENTLPAKSWGNYRIYLMKTCNCTFMETGEIVVFCSDVDMLINATAAQRAEAFLRTIGKWEARK